MSARAPSNAGKPAKPPRPRPLSSPLPCACTAICPPCLAMIGSISASAMTANCISPAGSTDGSREKSGRCSSRNRNCATGRRKPDGLNGKCSGCGRPPGRRTGCGGWSGYEWLRGVGSNHLPPAYETGILPVNYTRNGQSVQSSSLMPCTRAKCFVLFVTSTAFSAFTWPASI